MINIYIDESGDLGNDSRYFIITALIVNDGKTLNRIIRKINRTYRKQIGDSNEIKGVRTPNHIKKKIFKKLNNNDYIVYSIIFDKIDRYLLKHNYSNNQLYDLIAFRLANMITINHNTDIFIDKSKAKKQEIEEFNKKFIENLNNPKEYKLTIKHANSIHYKGLQIVDLISWSIFQKYENNNDEFNNLIKNKTLKTFLKIEEPTAT